MPNRSSTPKRPADLNQLAKAITDEATGETPEKLDEEAATEMHLAAVALGRLGGLKGGKARAEKLSARRRKGIAKKAAEARWRKAKKDEQS
jgi:hypothetical protein